MKACIAVGEHCEERERNVKYPHLSRIPRDVQVNTKKKRQYSTCVRLELVLSTYSLEIRQKEFFKEQVCDMPIGEIFRPIKRLECIVGTSFVNKLYCRERLFQSYLEKRKNNAKRQFTEVHLRPSHKSKMEFFAKLMPFNGKTWQKCSTLDD